MAHLTYFSDEGVGQKHRQLFSYSQVVRVGDRIEVAGQGGWDPATGEIARDIDAQVDRAFANVERCLRLAGVPGWAHVFRVKSYHVPLDGEAIEAMVRNFRRYMPDHQLLWTCVGAAQLAEREMRVEIEVVAHHEGRGVEGKVASAL